MAILLDIQMWSGPRRNSVLKYILFYYKLLLFFSYYDQGSICKYEYKFTCDKDINIIAICT